MTPDDSKSKGRPSGARSFRDAQKDKEKPGKSPGLPKPDLRPNVKTCTMCRSTYRDQMERLLVYGMTQSEVIKHMAELGEKISVNSMSNHVRKHMTLGDRAYRRMVEKQAEKQFENIEEVADSLLSNRAMLEVMRQKAFNAIVDDSVSIEPETALKIIDKLAADDAKHHQDRIDEMVLEMNILTRSMKQVLPEAMWAKVAEQFKTNLALERDKRQALLLGRGE